MFRKILIFIIFTTILLGLCGCWDSLDINKKELITTTIVGKDNNQVLFWSELANLSGCNEDGGNSKKFTVVKSHGTTYAQARENLENKLANPIFLGTIRIMAFTETLAKDCIGEYCYRMRDLQEYRKALNVITVPDDVDKLFEATKDSPLSVGNTIEAILSKLDKTGNVVKNSLSEILNHLSGDHVCFLVPHFVAEENLLKLDGYSVMREDVQVSFISISNATGIHFLYNDFVISTYTVPFASGEHTATVEVHLTDKKITPSYVNNEVYFNVEFDFFALVKYLDINDGLTEEYERQVEQNLDELISDDIEKAIVTSQMEPQSDYFKMREYFRIKYPNIIKDMDWNEEYPNANFSFNINIDLVPGREYDYNPDVKWKENNNE